MKSAKDQKSGGMKFDGMEPSSTGRSSKFAGNHWSGHSNDGRTVNKGRGPTVGNDGVCHPVKNAGGNPTKDAYRRPPTSATPSVPKQGSIRDNINRGQQYRGVGGTMPKQPSNPDQIRVKQSGGPDYGGTTKGSKPNTAAGRTDFNYGPKSQY
jgi:hypothetical protein